MKETMNSRDVSKFHKYLEQEISIDKCSKALGVSKKTLGKFNTDAIAKDTAKQAAKAKPSTAKPAAAAAK